MKTKKLYIRFSKKEDTQNILNFYNNNEHEYVAGRDPAVLKKMAQGGAVTLIEDEKGKIVATSISYPMTQKNDQGIEHHRWSEIGSTRVSLGGLGLFKVLFSAQLIKAFFLEPPEEKFVIEIDHDNKHSKHVFEKIGCEDFEDTGDIQNLAEQTMDPDDTGAEVDWYFFPAEKMHLLAQNMLNFKKNPQITNKKTGEVYELDFSRCQLFTVFEKELRVLANKPIKTPQNSNKRLPIKQASQQFLNHFKP